jgi:hypothetical protein
LAQSLIEIGIPTQLLGHDPVVGAGLPPAKSPELQVWCCGAVLEIIIFSQK